MSELWDWSTTDGNNDPPGQESRRLGDDRIRETRGGIRRAFPSVNDVVNANHVELNNTIGTTSAIQTQINTINNWINGAFPAGVHVAFLDTTLPVGWEIDIDIEADLNAFGLRSMFITNVGQGGYNNRGGDVDPELYENVAVHTHSFSVVQADHNHGIQVDFNVPTEGRVVIDADTGIAGNNSPQPAEENLITDGGGFTFNGVTEINAGGAPYTPRYHLFIIGKKT